MFHRENEVLRAGTGIAVPGATVTVYVTGTDTAGDYTAATKATIYPTNVVGVAIPNSVLTTDANGHYEYYAPDGVYDEVLHYGTITQVDEYIQMFDMSASENEAAASAAAAAASAITAAASATAAAASAAAALVSEGNAADSAADAATSAATAGTARDAAVTAELASEASANASETSRSGAAISETNAATSATAAAASATAAAASAVAAAAAARTPNVQAVASAATVTPDFANDLVKVTAQAAALALANWSGVAIPGLGLAIRIKDNGTARAITYGTKYRSIGVGTLPAATVIGKTLYLGCIYNADDDKFDVVAVAQEA